MRYFRSMSYFNSLFPSWNASRGVFMAFVFSLSAPAQASAANDYVSTREERLRSGLTVLASERKQVRSEFAERELTCLSRFVSAACLEDVRQGYARTLRDLDLIEELLHTEIRQLHSDARLRTRQQTIARHMQSLEEGRTK